MPEGAISSVAVPTVTVTKSKLLNMPSGAGTVATPPKRSKGEEASLDPVMASSSINQLSTSLGGLASRSAHGSVAGTNVVNKMLPFMSNGKLIERSLGLADGVVKSIYHPLCWIVVVVGVGVVVLQDFG